MPVMPEDETLNHIATQVIAEDLASLDNPTLDGMIYRSVEAAKDMKNVVLFHRAAVVAMVLRGAFWRGCIGLRLPCRI